MSRTAFSRRSGSVGPNSLVVLGISVLVLLLSAWLPLGAASATRASADSAASRLSSELQAAGWRLLTVPGKAHAEFTERGRDSIAVSAENAVAFLYRPVGDGMAPKRRLLWSWRVDRAAPPTDLSRAPGDDRSLAVHLVFPVDEDRLPFWERMEIALTRFVAPPLAGKVLTYVWGGTHPTGTLLTNPYLKGQGHIIVLRSGDEPVGQWLMEEIDFVADFQKAFGYRPPAPAIIAISADSDDTGGRIIGTVTGLAFEG